MTSQSSSYQFVDDKIDVYLNLEEFYQNDVDDLYQDAFVFEDVEQLLLDTFQNLLDKDLIQMDTSIVNMVR